MAGNVTGLLFRDSYKLNDDITIKIPTVREVLENEEDYYRVVSAFTATPFDYMLLLDECGLDFNKITEYELFTLLFPAIKEMDTSLIFDNINLADFEPMVDVEKKVIVFVDKDGRKIDRKVYRQIGSCIKEINQITVENKKAGNDEAKAYLLERARIKAARNHKSQKSQLEPIIIALVNTPEFKYDYSTVKDISIYQFNKSVHQVIKRIDYSNLMRGVYAGTVSTKDIKKSDLTWIPT